jgi:prepilin-type N-terminal cleavage/methylation domain-containing protein/prepilin-type processing-associated H-X9-DG protein
MKSMEIQNAKGGNHRAGHRRDDRGFPVTSGRGFTLIELLVVIFILVLLMALLMPTLQRVRNQARAVACQAKLRQWGIFYGARLAQGERIMSELFGTAHVTTEGKPTWWDERERCFGPQVYELSLCPMASRLSDRGIAKDVNTGGNHAAGSTFAAWWESSDKWKTIASSYGINAAVQTVGGTSDLDIARVSYPSGSWSDSAVGPWRAAIPVMLDCAVWWPSLGKDPPPYPDALAGWFETCINRHGGGTNHLFLDWSVRKVGLKELWTLKWNKLFPTRGPWTKAGGVQPEDWPAWMRGCKDY